MTKGELITALAELPDSAVVHVNANAVTNNLKAMILDCITERSHEPGNGGDLSTIEGVSIIEEDGDDEPAFAVIRHEMNYEPGEPPGSLEQVIAWAKGR